MNNSYTFAGFVTRYSLLVYTLKHDVKLIYDNHFRETKILKIIYMYVEIKNNLRRLFISHLLRLKQLRGICNKK